MYFNANYKFSDIIEANLSIDNLFDTEHYTAAPYGESIWIQHRAPQPLRKVYFGIRATL